MYNISYEMAEELIRHLYEKTYGIRKIKTTSPDYIEKILNLNIELQRLMKQLEDDGHDTSLLRQDIKDTLQKKFDYKKIEIYVDGGTRDMEPKDKAQGIERKGACAMSLYGDGELLVQNSYFLGDSLKIPPRNDSEEEMVIPMNVNIAEYMALIKALDYLLVYKPDAEEIHIYSDSETIVKQVNMRFTARTDYLYRLRWMAQDRLKHFTNLEVSQIPRDANMEANNLVYECMSRKVST